MAKNFTWCFKRTLFLTYRSMFHQQKPLAVFKPNNYAIQIRTVVDARANEINIDYDEPKDFREFADESKCGYSLTVETLTKILSVARANARKAVEDYPNFKLLPRRTIYKNFQILREEGVYKSTIKDNKYLLTDDTTVLRKKLKIIQLLDVDINDAAHLFHLPVTELSNFGKRSKVDATYLPTSNRIIYLAEKLQCDIDTMCEVMSYNPTLLRLPAPKLLTITEYVLGIGMAPEHILNDVSIYNYNLATIKNKMERAMRVGVHPLKPWLIRCQDEVWKKVEEKHAERESILVPGQSLVEHIREIFDCDVESVNFVLTKNPKLRAMDLEKLTKVMKLLRHEGYKIEDIQRTPTVMQRSYNCLFERFSQWRKATKKQPVLSQLTVGRERFQKAIESARFEDHEKTLST